MGFWDKVKGAAQEARGYQERRTTSREEDQARKIFRETLLYGRIYISNGLGFQQRPYTIPRSAGALTTYVIHLGPRGFTDALSGGVDGAGAKPMEFTFIHELAHVWQGHNNNFSLGYVFNSVWHQSVEGTGAYDYSPGQPWSSYNVEQQASIVEDWWRLGGKTNANDPRFRYIRDNIRGLQR